ncbi:MAG TPA: 16S rRNA (guanine(527)-N(7))-methyltransferase RsmG [Bacillota bacterium]|nr:16S rRNA (guanine(527)-N(7))-methyltransferase RsmG [Bacillota bacterium]
MKEELLKALVKGCEAEGIRLAEEQLQAFAHYAEMLVDWNNRVNLTAILDPQGIALKHFVDSLLCGKYFGLEGSLRLLDVGTGAGFPGIPLKIAYPLAELTLLDSLQKRIGFLSAVVEELNLDKVVAVHGRAEDVARLVQHREQYDVVVSRAVARLTVLAEYCLPFVKIGGTFIAMKGSAVNEELEESFKALQILGGKLDKVVEYVLPLSGDSRTLVIIRKSGATPAKYPRKAGLPEKTPL